MPWGNKFPDMKNDPTYLEGRLSNAETSLADKATRLSNIWVDVKQDFGAKGDGVTDDTTAIKNAINAAIGTNYLNAGKKRVYFPPGTYLVSGSILDTTSANSLIYGVELVGGGESNTVIQYTGSGIFINLVHVSQALIKDMTIIGNNSGVGIQFGIADNVNSFTNSVIERVQVQHFTTGYNFLYAYSNCFINMKARYCTTGFSVAGGSEEYYSILAENNTTGVVINSGTHAFVGGTIETNTLGLNVLSGSVALLNTYFENNTNGHINAGTGSGTVANMNIDGIVLNNTDTLLFDKVQNLNIKGINNYGGNNSLIITENVQNYNFPSLMGRQTSNYDVATSVNVKNLDAQSSIPIYSMNMDNVNVTDLQPYLDKSQLFRINNDSGTRLSSVTKMIDEGATVLQFKDFAGKSTLERVGIYCANPAMFTKTYYTAVFRMKTVNVLTSFFKNITVYWKDTSNVTQSTVIFTNVPNLTSFETGVYMTFILPIDLSSIKSQPTFSSLSSILINFYFNSGTQVTTGNEVIYLERFDLYQTKYPVNAFAEKKANYFNPIEVNPYSLNILGGSYSFNGLKKVKGTAAPTTGTWNIGDVIENTTPTASGYMGWVCITAGTPGTWKGYGAIQA